MFSFEIVNILTLTGEYVTIIVWHRNRTNANKQDYKLFMLTYARPLS